VSAWSARMRHGNLTLNDPLDFAELELVENYGPPDTLSLTGDLDQLRPVLKPGRGCVVWDGNGVQRFNGVIQSIERRGDQSATATFVSDLQRLWDRVVYPNPTASWTAQSLNAHDVQTGVHEARIIAYVRRNAGDQALNTGSEQRRIPSLRLPTSLGRGVSRTYRGRFQNLGAVVAQHAENASLRVTIKQTYEGTTPYLDLLIEDTPDLSSWAKFGDANTSTIGSLDESYRYTVTAPTATHLLSAAGGEGTARTLTLRSTTRADDWWRRVELFVDQRGSGTDASDITEGLDEAELESASEVSVEAPLAVGDLTWGPGGIAVGSKVTALIDGEQVIERVRTITTTVTASESDETEVVTPTIGADNNLDATERALLKALRRIRELERSV
jgi:Siphovirus ReqiPepy6 Gp37-like protein